MSLPQTPGRDPHHTVFLKSLKLHSSRLILFFYLMTDVTLLFPAMIFIVTEISIWGYLFFFEGQFP